MGATRLLQSGTDADYLAMEALLMAFVDDVRAQLTASEPLARLRQLASAHVRWRLEHPEIAEVFDVAFGVRTRVQSLPGDHRARIRAIKRMYVDELRAVLNAGARSGTFDFADVRVTAFAIVSLCGSAHTWFDPEGDLTVGEVASMYADFTEPTSSAGTGVAGMVRAPMRVE